MMTTGRLSGDDMFIHCRLSPLQGEGGCTHTVRVADSHMRSVLLTRCCRMLLDVWASRRPPPHGLCLQLDQMQRRMLLCFCVRRCFRAASRSRGRSGRAEGFREPHALGAPAEVVGALAPTACGRPVARGGSGFGAPRCQRPQRDCRAHRHSSGAWPSRHTLACVCWSSARWPVPCLSAVMRCSPIRWQPFAVTGSNRHGKGQQHSAHA